jgi:hypothetical protein
MDIVEMDLRGGVRVVGGITISAAIVSPVAPAVIRKGMVAVV